MIPDDQVWAASAGWVYVPEDAPHVITDEFALVAYPPYFTLPTAVHRIDTDRSAAPVIATDGQERAFVLPVGTRSA